MKTVTAKRYQDLMQEFLKTPRSDAKGFRKKYEEVLNEFLKLDEVYVVASRSATVEEVKEKWGYSFAELKGMKAYWIYAAAFVFIGIYVSVLASQYSAYLKSIGFDAGTLANVASTFAFFSVIGNLSGGFLYDKLGVTKTTIIGFTLALIACVSLLFAEQMPQLAYLYGVTKGLSVFAYMLAPSMLASALFGPKEFGPVFSITNIFFALGFAFGSVGFGLLVGALGYQVSWIVILASIVIGYLLLLTAIKSFLKLNKENFGR